MMKGITASLIVALVLFMAAGHGGSIEAERVVMVKVIDGDTMGVMYRQRYEKLRLIGIDTPESRKNSRAWRQADRRGERIEAVVQRGREVKEYVRRLLKPDMMVFIEFDVQKRDRYRRLLAYLYLPGGEMLNEKLLREGYASLYTVPPNVKYRDRFLRAWRQGRKSSSLNE